MNHISIQNLAYAHNKSARIQQAKQLLINFVIDTLVNLPNSLVRIYLPNYTGQVVFSKALYPDELDQYKIYENKNNTSGSGIPLKLHYASEFAQYLMPFVNDYNTKIRISYKGNIINNLLGYPGMNQHNNEVNIDVGTFLNNY